LRRRGWRSSGELKEAKAQGADNEKVGEGRHVSFIAKVIR
jgi:hypothetical protein